MVHEVYSGALLRPFSCLRGLREAELPASQRRRSPSTLAQRRRAVSSELRGVVEVWVSVCCDRPTENKLRQSASELRATSKSSAPCLPETKKGTPIFNSQSTPLNISPVACCSCLLVPVVCVVTHPPLLTKFSCCPGVKPLQGWIREP